VLSQVPFVKILVPFVLGIVWAIRFPEFSQIMQWALIGSLLSLPVLSFYKARKKESTLYNYTLLITLFIIGAWLSNQKMDEINNCELNLKTSLLYVSVSEIPQLKMKTTKLTTKVHGVFTESKRWKPVSEKLIIYLNKKLRVPKVGDYLIVKCSLNEISEPENPFQFNYKEFLKWQGIHFQTFVQDSSNLVFTGKNGANLIQLISSQGVSYLNIVIKANIKDTVAVGVTESLLYGYKDDLSRDLVNSYAHTGTLHVLAVSGMHVAIVFLMFAKMLWFLDRFKHGRWVKTLIVMLAIWGYCVLTGLAPSILRAGFMISLILIGKAINRHAQAFNLMAVSAFVILLFNPFWILNVGFQLSFAAVAGIVYLQSYVLRLYTPPNLFLKEVWNILAISICAQIATFPISLYYFNQFPNYFLLSNLLIIPLSTLVIYSGVCLVLFAKVPVIAGVAAWITEKTVIFTNYIVSQIESLPFSYTDGIKVDSVQLALLYVSIFACIYWLVQAKKLGFYFCIISVALISGISFFDKMMLQKRNSIVFFNIPSQNAILFSDGRKSILLVDSVVSEKHLFYIRGWLINQRLWPVNNVISIDELQGDTGKHFPLGLFAQKDVLLFKSIKLRLHLNSNNLFPTDYTYIFPNRLQQNQKIVLDQTDTLIIGQSKNNQFHKKLFQLLEKMPFERKYFMKKNGFKVKYF
jgi:competence protein ComEC